MLVLALVTVMLGATVGAALHQREIGAVLHRLHRRLSPPPQVPAGPPIERIAGDLRRLRAEMLALTPGTPMARRIGVSRAYDDLLAEACRALDVPDTLSGLAAGTERDAERLMVMSALRSAGLQVWE